jgi:hypothetical protein
MQLATVESSLTNSMGFECSAALVRGRDFFGDLKKDRVSEAKQIERIDDYNGF